MGSKGNSVLWAIQITSPFGQTLLAVEWIWGSNPKKKFWNLKTGRISIIWNRKNINYSKTEFDCDFLFHPSRSIDTVTLNHHFLVGKTWILWKKQPKAVFTKKIKKFWEKGIFKLNERLHQVVEQNIESIFEFF